MGRFQSKWGKRAGYERRVTDGEWESCTRQDVLRALPWKKAMDVIDRSAVLKSSNGVEYRKHVKPDVKA